MAKSVKRSVWLLIALALLATACRADATVAVADDRAAAQDQAPAAVDSGNGESAEPTPTSTEPDITSDGGASGDEPAPRGLGTGDDGEFVRPNETDTPISWDDPLPKDPGLIEGTLDNGLRYVVRSNDSPGSQAQLRLVVQAGSLNEADGRYGVAHFLEHMMFNGTEKYPGNEIVQVLEAFGSGFGPDINAYTSFEETVYELQVPARDVATLELGLDVLAQWASAATLDPDAVVDERGVVREEYRRSVEPLSGRIGREIRQVLFEGTDYLNREPIGTIEVIDTMSQADVLDFYQRWYRPELFTIVAVGDFDPFRMQELIISAFDTPPSGGDLIEPLEIDRGPGSLPAPTYDIFTDAEIQSSELEVLWRMPDRPVVTRNDLRDDFVSSMAINMLNDRVFEFVQSGQGVLIGGNASQGGLTVEHQLVSMTGRADPDQIDQALTELLTQAEQARQYGFTDDEFQRAVATIETFIDQTFAESDTRQDSSFAGEFVEYALVGSIPVGAADQQTIGLEVLQSISPADTQAFLFDVLESEPYVLVTAPASDEAVLPAPEALAESYERTVGAPVEARVETATAQNELVPLPDPVSIVERDEIPALEATVVTYENGVRLAYRQTQITENVVQLQAVSPGGYFAIEGDAVPLLGWTQQLVSGSGFDSIDVVTLDRLLTGSIASAGTSVSRSEEYVSGESSSGDIEKMFQLVHLSMSEPTITDLRLRQFDERWRPLAQDPSLSPAIAGDLRLWDLRYGDSPWFRYIPTVADLDGLDQELLLDAYKDRFADAGDFIFVVVGDFDNNVVEDLGARYLGTLPDSGRREEPIDRDPGLPEQNLVETVRAGIGDQGRLRINWESPYPFTLDAFVAAEALELVVDARLRDLIREELSASYAPNAAVSVLFEPKSWIDTIIEVESDPERIEEVSVAVRDELDRIRAGEIAQRYLDLAIDQLTEDYRFFSNNDWLDTIWFAVNYEERGSGEVWDRADVARRLTIADLVEAANLAFPPNRSVEIRLLPG